MQTVEKIWIDGQFVSWGDANIHVLTHTLHYGAGVFEGIRFYKTKNGTAVFRLSEHIKRLFYSAQCIDMEIPFSREELKQAILDTIKINHITAGYIRPICFFGYGKMGLNPQGAPVNVVIAVWPWGSYLGDDPVKVKISKYIRIHPKSLIPDAKICGHYVNSILASLESHKAGFDEALFLDYQGYIAEGPGENIFLIQKNKILTPQKGSILPGITRDSVIQIAKNQKIEIIEKQIAVAELKAADELFFTGTAAEISPIASIDEKIIGNGLIGEITTKLKHIFNQIVTGNHPEYQNWLTKV